ncbi:MAG: tRNA (adenosine(37)-N6)-threonylcarbamoyltransferase complex ATPase subunit type 1 TsaE [Solirubrobacterales bacterium]
MSEVEVSDGPEATAALGARIAAELSPGDVVLVSGELGSGKTTLIRGACHALGVAEQVVSPTFTIGRRYRGGVPVSHLDLYRLEGAGLEAEDPGLLDDYLTPDAISFIEWPAAAVPELGRDDVRVAREIELRHAGGARREISVSAPVAGPPEPS